MQATTTMLAGPLARLSESEIEDQLRGFPKGAVSGTFALRETCRVVDMESCLFSILSFYLPAGTTSLPAEPSSDTLLRDDLGLDSLSLAEAMFKIEDLFDIRVENAELAEVATIGDARRLLMSKLNVPCPDGYDE